MNQGGKSVRAGIYLRISEDRTGEELGVARQREDAEKLCADRGWIPVAYTDNDLSAKLANRRPAFKQMLADVESGELRAVVAWSLDRLTRNARDRLALIEACQRRGVVIALIQGSDMNPATAAGRMVIGVLGEVSQMEIELKSERQIRAARQRAESGRAHTGCRWFGYTMPNKDGLGIQIEPAEAELLRDAYSAVLSGGTLNGICRDWNTRGIKTVLGNPWKSTTLRLMLLNARYCGIRVYRGEEIGTGEWEPIIPEDVYRGVVAILKDPARVHPPVNGYGRQYLLSGVARCGRCDHPVAGTTARNTKQARSSYQCPNCRRVVRSVPDTDAWVIGHVVEYLSRPETIALTEEPDRPEIAELRLEKKALVGRQGELTAALSDPDMPIAEVKAAAAVIRDKITAINARLQSANNSRELDGALPDEEDRDAYYALPHEQRLAIAQERFDALSRDRQRTVIDKLVTVRILPGQPPRGGFRPEFVPVEPKVSELVKHR